MYWLPGHEDIQLYKATQQTKTQNQLLQSTQDIQYMTFRGLQIISKRQVMDKWEESWLNTTANKHRIQQNTKQTQLNTASNVRRVIKVTSSPSRFNGLAFQIRPLVGRSCLEMGQWIARANGSDSRCPKKKKVRLSHLQNITTLKLTQIFKAHVK